MSPKNTNAPVLVMFHRIGPYHLARLRGADIAVPNPVVGLEASDGDGIYAWDQVEDGSLRKITAFEGQDSATLSRPELLKRYRQIFETECPIALFILGWTHLGIAGLIAANELRIPVVLMSESSAHDFSRNPIKEWIKRRVVRGCCAALVGGESHREYLVSLGMSEHSISTGYDVVDNEYFSREADRHRNDVAGFENDYGIKRPFFLASNRFIAKKNLSTLYRAYAKYCERAGENAWDLVSLGDGELHDELCSLRKKLNLQTRIHMPGFIQYQELPRFYAMAKCFVHLSFREQWGLVINEAMASGLPVIVSEPCGSASMIQEGINGWVVDPMDVELVAERLFAFSSLSTVQQEKMGEMSLSTIAGFGLNHFGAGFHRALTSAQEASLRKPSVLDQLTWRFALSRL